MNLKLDQLIGFTAHDGPRCLSCVTAREAEDMEPIRHGDHRGEPECGLCGALLELVAEALDDIAAERRIDG